MQRHKGLDWAKIQSRLEASPAKLWSLNAMEATEGEPDVVAYDKSTDEYVFMIARPKVRKAAAVFVMTTRRSKKKEHKPADSALNMAEEMGITILNEEEYRYLQTLGSFDTKTSSWIKTPPEIRQLGGALFGDRRYNAVFIYHNGADSYYAARGFRGSLRV
jgi:hypothetical protein